MRHLGLVKWFNKEKGFGVIGTPDNGEVFLHHSKLDQKIPEKFEGIALIFETRNEKGKTIAFEVTSPSDFDDFSLILSYLHSPHEVSIEVTVAGKSRWGNPYKRKEKHSIDIVSTALTQFFEGQQLSNFISCFKQYFDNTYANTTGEGFLEFLNLFHSVIHKLQPENPEQGIRKVLSHFLTNLNHDILFKVWLKNLHVLNSYHDFDEPTDESYKEASIEFPEEIFIENFSSIRQVHHERIRSLKNGHQILECLLAKKIENLNSIKYVEVYPLYSWIKKIKDENFSEKTQQLFLDKLKILLSECDCSDESDITSNNLYFIFVEILTELHESDQEVQKAIDNILPKLRNDLLFLVWRGYFHNVISHQLSDDIWDTFENNDDLKSSYAFPESMFVEKYSVIQSKDVQRISGLPKGDHIISEILNKRTKYLDSFSKHEIETQIHWARFIHNVEVRSYVEKRLLNKLLGVVTNFDFSNRSDEVLENFSFIIEKVKSNFERNNYEALVVNFNKDTTDEIIFWLWQKTKYFEPDSEFFQRNYQKLTYHDFIKANDTFHLLYFKHKLKEIVQPLNPLSFGVLICTIVEIPRKIINEEFTKLPIKFQLSLWLNFPRMEDGMGKHYEADYSKSDILLDVNKIIEFLKGLDSIDEIVHLSGIVRGIQNQYKSNTEYHIRGEGFWNHDLSERLKLVEEILTRQDVGVSDFLRAVLYRATPDHSVLLFKTLIPRLIGEQNITIKELVELLSEADISETTRTKIFDHVGQSFRRNDRVYLWYKGYSAHIDPKDAIAEFHTFKISEQSKLLRKTFSLLQSGTEMSVDDFFDCLLTLLNEDNIHLDIQICLSVLQSLKNGHDYLGENIISEIVCRSVNENIYEVIQILDFFEECKGRTWMTESVEETEWFLNIKGKDFPVSRDKVLIGDKEFSFDKESKNLVIDGIKYRFRWSKKENNTFSKTYDKPKEFCDAVKSEYDPKVKCNFFWCNNSKCYDPCQNDHIEIEWRKYSLRDFIKMLNLPFEMEKYYRFVSVVNRSNRLLKKLQCSSCHKLLRDSKTSLFAFYRVTTFHCTNSECQEYHQAVYLNHCLNWKCDNVVDSRISMKCPNGWFICDSCDNCCSQKVIDRRYENLIINNAFNPNNTRHQKLKNQVDYKLGHLEKGEIFNYKTGEKGRSQRGGYTF